MPVLGPDDRSLSCPCRTYLIIDEPKYTGCSRYKQGAIRMGEIVLYVNNNEGRCVVVVPHDSSPA